MGRNSLRKIAAEVGCSVNTVRRYLEEPAEARYTRQRSVRPKLGPFEAYVRERVTTSGEDRLPAALLAREIRERGYSGSERQVARFVRGLRPGKVEEPLTRFKPAPGEKMHVEWVEFKPPADRTRTLAAFVAVLAYRRATYVEYVSDEQVATLLDCHHRAFEFFGGVPRSVLYTNARTVVQVPDASEPGRHRFHPAFLDFARHHGFLPRLHRKHGSNGSGARTSRHLRYWFHIPVVAKLLDAGLAIDAMPANTEVRRWLREVANGAVHDGSGNAPRGEFEIERRALMPLRPWKGRSRPSLQRERSPASPQGERSRYRRLN